MILTSMTRPAIVPPGIAAKTLDRESVYSRTVESIAQRRRPRQVWFLQPMTVETRCLKIASSRALVKRTQTGIRSPECAFAKCFQMFVFFFDTERNRKVSNSLKERKKGHSHPANAHGPLNSPDTLVRNPEARLWLRETLRPCRIHHGAPEGRGRRTWQRCKPTVCSNGGTRRV